MARARASRLEFGVPKRDGAETPLAESGVISLVKNWVLEKKLSAVSLHLVD